MAKGSKIWQEMTFGPRIPSPSEKPPWKAPQGTHSPDQGQQAHEDNPIWSSRCQYKDIDQERDSIRPLLIIKNPQPIALTIYLETWGLHLFSARSI